METQIKWLDISIKRGKSSELNDYQFMTYRQPKKKTGNYVQFSLFFSEIYKDWFLKVGEMGDRLVFNFNKETGLPVKTYTTNKNSRVACASLVKLIFDKLGHNQNESINIYDLIDIGSNTFIITKTQ